MKLINKAQQRCLVKALATAGLGLEIYAGEDLPEEPAKKQTKSKDKPVKQKLEDYPITFNGQPTTMGILMKHFKEGNSAAVNYVNSLGGEAQKVFEELLNSKAGNGN
ncbi:hypothetical protein CBF58_07425 [Lactobacillus taiwanensis]|nr:hypothetical protein CBF59_03810 [Lactobacillus taiwanensis]OYR95353.1 hypothetical protein CBF58_07425 [Lactobacillus taiwanensis]